MYLNAEEESTKLQNKLCVNAYRSSYKRFKGYEMPAYFEKFQEQIENMEIYDDDIWLVTFPKCGTTWTQEIVWCMCNKLDFEGAKVSVDVRFPHLEICTLFEIIPIPNSVEAAKNLKRPRFIKTHLPWELLPKQIREFRKHPKIINVIRRAEDVCTSYYHHAIQRDFYRGTFEEYCFLFLNDKLAYTPFFKHILSTWKHRIEENILILRYEDMKIDNFAQIKIVADFLGVELRTKDAEKLLQHCSFDEMKNNPAVQHTGRVHLFNNPDYQPTIFFRKGVVGSFRDEMGEKMIKEFEVWTKESLKGIDINY